MLMRQLRSSRARLGPGHAGRASATARSASRTSSRADRGQQRQPGVDRLRIIEQQRASGDGVGAPSRRTHLVEPVALGLGASDRELGLGRTMLGEGRAARRRTQPRPRRDPGQEPRAPTPLPRELPAINVLTPKPADSAIWSLRTSRRCSRLVSPSPRMLVASTAAARSRASGASTGSRAANQIAGAGTSSTRSSRRWLGHRRQCCRDLALRRVARRRCDRSSFRPWRTRRRPR